MDRPETMIAASNDTLIAVVTGGSREIGRAICLALSGAGVRVVVGCQENVDLADQVCGEIERDGGNAVPFLADISNPQGAEALLQAPLRAFGKPANILVNNAGICTPGNLHTITDSDWEQVMATNLMGPWWTTRAFARLLDGQEGDIINIASTAATAPLGRSHHYVASKAALLGITKSLALELAPAIRVNAVVPGYVATERHKSGSVKEQGNILDRTPLCYIIKPSEIANYVLYFATMQCHATGTVLIMN
ncbi:MAG: SDR family NAD(P)-dependent oxidoreductase [Candidatus Hydrogenedentes bacterium]|nr:SDR family NAD(P)-dependent oxidoreductase [Candidatus Hydrogenedentota bacterium]